MALGLFKQQDLPTGVTSSAEPGHEEERGQDIPEPGQPEDAGSPSDPWDIPADPAVSWGWTTAEHLLIAGMSGQITAHGLCHGQRAHMHP